MYELCVAPRNMWCVDSRFWCLLAVVVVVVVCVREVRGEVSDGGVAGNVSRAGNESDGGNGRGALYNENPLLDIVYYDGVLGSAWEASIVAIGQSEDGGGEPTVPSLFAPSFESGGEEDGTVFFAFLNGRDELLLSSTTPFTSDFNITIVFESELQPLAMRVGPDAGGDALEPPVAVNVLEYTDEDSIAMLPLSLSVRDFALCSRMHPTRNITDSLTD